MDERVIMIKPARAVRLGRMTPEERLHYDACNSPPTTAEWLACLRRSGDKTRFWYREKWMRRPRPFVWPRVFPLGPYTGPYNPKLP